MGLEVGPDPQGAVVKAVEATARRLGVQANDLVSSINGMPIRSVADFVQATQNGGLSQGVLIVVRNGQRLAFDFSQTAAPSPPPVAPTPAAYSPFSAAQPGMVAPANGANPAAPCPPWGQTAPVERRF